MFLSVIFLSLIYNNSLAAAEKKGNLKITLQGRNSATVFELLKESHEVEYKTYDTGVFVTAIDGIPNTASTYWTYLVNGKKVPVSADKATVSEGDKIEWIFK